MYECKDAANQHDDNQSALDRANGLKDCNEAQDAKQSRQDGDNKQERVSHTTD